MRSNELVLAALVVLAAGCAVSLDPDPAPVPLVPVAPGCELAGGDLSLASGGRSLPPADGGGWLVPLRAGGYALSPQFPGCGAAAALSPLVALSPQDGISIHPLDIVAVDGYIWFFYTASRGDPGAPFGQREVGGGVGKIEGGELRPQGGLLWSADDPPYGQGAVIHGGLVYAYGCREVAGEFRAICRAARAPVAKMSEAASWEYGQGSGRWGVEREQAMALVEANEPSVRRRGDEFVMIYAPVLGREVVERTALLPDGPWSRPRPLFTCDLPGEGWICSNVALHAAPDGSPLVTYSPLDLGTLSAALPRVVSP